MCKWGHKILNQRQWLGVSIYFSLCHILGEKMIHMTLIRLFMNISLIIFCDKGQLQLWDFQRDVFLSLHKRRNQNQNKGCLILLFSFQVRKSYTSSSPLDPNNSIHSEDSLWSNTWFREVYKTHNTSPLPWLSWTGWSYDNWKAGQEAEPTL